MLGYSLVKFIYNILKQLWCTMTGALQFIEILVIDGTFWNTNLSNLPINNLFNHCFYKHNI